MNEGIIAVIEDWPDKLCMPRHPTKQVLLLRKLRFLEWSSLRPVNSSLMVTRTFGAIYASLREHLCQQQLESLRLERLTSSQSNLGYVFDIHFSTN